jgi:hypothetical protein
MSFENTGAQTSTQYESANVEWLPTNQQSPFDYSPAGTTSPYTDANIPVPTTPLPAMLNLTSPWTTQQLLSQLNVPAQSYPGAWQLPWQSAVQNREPYPGLVLNGTSSLVFQSAEQNPYLQSPTSLVFQSAEQIGSRQAGTSARSTRQVPEFYMGGGNTRYEYDRDPLRPTLMGLASVGISQLFGLRGGPIGSTAVFGGGMAFHDISRLAQSQSPSDQLRDGIALGLDLGCSIAGFAYSVKPNPIAGSIALGFMGARILHDWIPDRIVSGPLARI